MKSQEARERQALVIGTALAIFVAFVIVSAVVLAAFRAATGRDVEPAVMWAVAASGLLAGSYLVRHRR